MRGMTEMGKLDNLRGVDAPWHLAQKKRNNSIAGEKHCQENMRIIRATGTVQKNHRCLWLIAYRHKLALVRAYGRLGGSGEILRHS
jgi:hypothetical protein